MKHSVFELAFIYGSSFDELPLSADEIVIECPFVVAAVR